MENEKLKNLEKELDLYRKKLTQMQKDWSASRGGSRYGDEYLEMQIKVYQENKCRKTAENFFVIV
ncbi:MAG: hypothetical protein US90_C0018G0054 [Candidatus Shapirobacteria bacterium GW2011_GWE2_38_30]|uniref:Uncharacterized protein n=1 Tax=Candidatus Shapirobacteria bacterium GW2011_GWE2_38_30 TaxID=1618490 RepID=A0A0G0K197_9BACT|nr:MAG: hypothetical protein US90_C0018G0054 [Candidatus Shapirobacteria bacterium GW2011_GWE2_38_30]